MAVTELVADPPPAAPEGTAPSSPSGPAPEDGQPLALPPALGLPRALQTLRFNIRQIELVFRARRELGEIFQLRTLVEQDLLVMTSHPDHVKSMFTSKSAHTHSLAGESPLRPIIGPNSVLTAIGPRHLRQRKLLLPPFHGDAVQRYTAMISEAAEREIDSWPIGTPFALAKRMQAVTLDVIMAGIFGVEGRPAKGTPAYGLRRAIRVAADLSTRPVAQLAELMNVGHEEPVGAFRAVLAHIDRYVYAIIAARRVTAASEQRGDVLSMLLEAETDEGERLTDHELRDELLTLVLAGHETTANTLAWIFERLLRYPAAYDRLRETVRAGDDDGAYLEATIHEGMRSRPVIPIVGRRVNVPWQFGDYRVPGGTAVLVSILLLHHREDVYENPFAFQPERFLGRKPGTYTWLPFGGGVRRCLGATLAMAEQRVVLEAIARRTDLVAPDPRPERARHRNVTMIPSEGARVVVTARRPA